MKKGEQGETKDVAQKEKRTDDDEGGERFKVDEEIERTDEVREVKKNP